MQEQNLTQLLNEALKHSAEPKKATKIKMEDLALKNKNYLSNKPLPDYLRIPTPDELIEMRQYAIDYKKLNKQASKREVRRAVQSKFNIRIFR